MARMLSIPIMRAHKKEIASKMNLLGWNLTDRCNYRCSYCITAPTRGLGNTQRIPALTFIDRFSEILSGAWNISLEGLGEPFCAPDFFAIVQKLSEKEYYISTSTNFSSSYAEIDRFLQMAGDRLISIGASLHLDHTGEEKFLEKVIYFNKIIPGKIFVKYVATRRGVALLDKIATVLKRHHIKLLVFAERMQTEKGQGYSRDYSDEELARIKRNTSVFWRDLSFTNRLCWTGCKHFVVADNGSAYRCAPARTYHSTEHLLGNIFDVDFKLFAGPMPCTVPNCYCSFSWLSEGSPFARGGDCYV